MSITLTSPGQSLTLPKGWTIQSENQTTKRPDKKLVGKRGISARMTGQQEMVKKIVIGGSMKASNSSTLITTYDNIQRAQGQGGIVFLTESTQGRTMKCLISSTNWVKRAGLVISGQITLVGITGTWTDNIEKHPISVSHTVEINDSSAAELTGTPLLKIWYTGSAPTRPNMYIDSRNGWPNATIEWMGGNLVKNSSVADIVDGAEMPTYWEDQNRVNWENTFGRSDNFSIKMGKLAAVNAFRTDTFAITPGLDYTASCYVMVNSGSANVFIHHQWVSSTSKVINDDIVPYAVGDSGWTRISRTDLAPDWAVAARLRVRLGAGATDTVVWCDDFQYEQSSATTTYFNTNISRNMHRKFTRTSAITAGDTILFDQKNDRIMRYDTTLTKLVSDDAQWNGQFFELVPGWNYLAFGPGANSLGMSFRIEFNNEYF